MAGNGEKNMRIRLVIGSLIALVSVAPSLGGTPLTTAFTYQGQLKQGGAPVEGAVDLRFSLYDAATDRLGNLVAGPVDVTNVAVVNGLFTVWVDFGAAAFAGDRWLQIAVASPAGSGSFTTLTPRQPLTPAPFALQTRGIFVNDPGNVGVGTAAPDGKLHVSSGPLWTDNGWRKSLTLDAGAAIELGRGTTTKFGVGVTQNTLYFFRTTTDAGAGSGPANYVLTADVAGRVGLGTTAPSERLDLGGGNIAMGYEIVSVRLPSGLVIANCPPGKRVISGGCWGGSNHLLGSIPNDDLNTPEYDPIGWNCMFEGVGGFDNMAVVICANMK